MWETLKGYRTVIVNVGIGAIVAGLTYVAGYDWTQVVSPTVAAVILAVVNVVLRWMTTTPIFQKD